jgi:hypothetical protein
VFVRSDFFFLEYLLLLLPFQVPGTELLPCWSFCSALENSKHFTHSKGVITLSFISHMLTLLSPVLNACQKSRHITVRSCALSQQLNFSTRKKESEQSALSSSRKERNFIVPCPLCVFVDLLKDALPNEQDVYSIIPQLCLTPNLEECGRNPSRLRVFSLLWKIRNRKLLNTKLHC